ncbi:PAS sensor-containing diguanylate cyclase/phosphodiesterase [Campylobacter hyointestinalis subsp. hyointestinalis LMG 9260]|uniref:bifunctional diguanylate cyclase/phosphodiesterase n=1 Tax=Campylobacter hyointestinalis TaxID=198 RepID=UPI0007C9159A|nr:GGDEF domain-containing phosphodiesterase [Campylobacter hyointestinalis]ANE33317.1 PAS sensor-containing diguanylate cyclase/phosphodiesterase [Campylobacter hyointestinalis subsp. hyointestinalis LMG 9260]SUW89513.1 diguanylate cyclase/phosphodiesterase [Campylobacter hyointestinalis]
MNKKHILNGLILSLIMLLSTFCTYSIYSSINTLQKSNYWNNQIFKIGEINKEIDIWLGRQISIVSYDQINEQTTGIFNIINDMEMSKDFDKFTFIVKNAQMFQAVKKAFHEKQAIVQRYQVLKTNSDNALLYLNNNLAYTSNSYLSNTIYSEVIQGKIGLNNHISTTKQKIKTVLENITDQKSLDYSFFKKAEIVVDNMYEFDKLDKQNKELLINQKLNELGIGINEYFKGNIKSILAPFILLFLLVIDLSIRTIYLSTKNNKNKAILSYMKNLIQNSMNSIIIIDKAGKILSVNKAFETTSGYSKKEIIGKSIYILKTNMNSDSIYDNLLKNISNNQIWSHDDFISKTKNGVLMYEKVVAVPTFNEYYEVSGAVILKKDITKERLIARELNFKTQEIKKNSLIDKLTGLKNNIAIMEKIDRKKFGNIIYINLNNFTNLRFFYKNSIIELILIAVAQTLKLCIDAYKMNGVAYRIQGDEFCVWYEGNTLQEDIKRIIEYFSAKNIEIVTDYGKEILPNIGITIGVSLTQDTQNTNRLTQAILAHHEAKANDSQVAYYKDNNSTEQQYHTNQLVSRMIQYALNQNKVIVECQGIFDIQNFSTPKIASYEVLIRILDGENKIHYPGEFLGVAKHTSLYIALTKEVINKTFDLVETFADKRFSINLSSIDMVNEGVKKLFIQKLKACSNPNHLTVEILESEGIDDYASINPFIESIKDHGCKLAIDDFGSGYSNYYRMLELNIDYLKIDGSIIKKLPTDENARSVVRTIVDFANRQGYDVVAEFVATEEILTQVKSYNIKYAQGFLLGKPTHPSNID